MSEHSDLKPHHFKSGPPHHRIQLFLFQKKKEGCMPVLLLHGASARHETFMIPRSRCLMDYLWEEDFEPWLLDWRGSGKVVDAALRNGTLEKQLAYFDFDYAAEWDIPEALRIIREVRRFAGPIGAVGHCLGAGTLAQAIAGGTVEGSGLTHVVLLTLGLFYEPPLDSRLKTQDHLLERLMREPELVLAVDPRVGAASWAHELEEMYQNWPNPLRPHRGEKLSPVHEMCDRLSFMYGTPYFERNLVQDIHHSGTWTIWFQSGRKEPSVGSTITGDVSGATGILDQLILPSDSWEENAVGAMVLSKVSGTFRSGEGLKVEDRVIATSTSPAVEGELPRQFGAIPLKMYVHGARNVRRGWAAKYHKANDDVELLQHRERFDRLERVTLITGDKNQLWHRDSIDRMYEWLTRGSPKDKFQKRIIPDYGHQDLLWGKDALKEVFPEIREGLPPTGGKSERRAGQKRLA